MQAGWEFTCLGPNLMQPGALHHSVAYPSAIEVNERSFTRSHKGPPGSSLQGQVFRSILASRDAAEWMRFSQVIEKPIGSELAISLLAPGKFLYQAGPHSIHVPSSSTLDTDSHWSRAVSNCLVLVDTGLHHSGPDRCSLASLRAGAEQDTAIVFSHTDITQVKTRVKLSPFH